MPGSGRHPVEPHERAGATWLGASAADSGRIAGLASPGRCGNATVRSIESVASPAPVRLIAVSPASVLAAACVGPSAAPTPTVPSAPGAAAGP